ncbi:hypothetical protein D3OALGA1CA_2578 [Olavius algarvensis associated proteobacterium Delta 3]|nr:hypothetical protein D3OALGA1CA_2578 [Olavius algarvensis associated proteobacterium Delta 3]
MHGLKAVLMACVGRRAFRPLVSAGKREMWQQNPPKSSGVPASRDWIVPTGMKRMASEHSLHRQTHTLHHAITFDGCFGIFGAGGVKPAGGSQKRR